MTNEQIVEIEKLPVKIKQLLNLAVFKSTLRVLDQEKYKEYFPIAKAIEYCVLENKNVFDYDCMKNRQNRQSSNDVSRLLDFAISSMRIDNHVDCSLPMYYFCFAEAEATAKYTDGYNRKLEIEDNYSKFLIPLFLPFEGWKLSWRTTNTVGVARTIYATENYSLCNTILWDALQDAGCENIEVFLALSSSFMCRGCWILEQLQ